jgi:hypothetical protein
MGSETTPSSTSQRLQNFKATKIIHSFNLTPDAIARSFVYILIVVVIAKSPIIATAPLLEKHVISLVLPYDSTFCLLRRVKTLLDNFRFHVHKNSVSLENISSVLITVEVSFDQPLPYKLATFFDFLKHCLEKGLTQLVPALPYLHGKHWH